MSGEGGFWNAPKVVYSKQTHDLLKDMMKESRLTNFQQRHIERTLKEGGNLPANVPPTSSKCGSLKSKSQAPLPKVLNPRICSGGIRSKDTMQAMGAFEKPEYTPSVASTLSPRKELLPSVFILSHQRPQTSQTQPMFKSTEAKSEANEESYFWLQKNSTRSTREKEKLANIMAYGEDKPPIQVKSSKVVKLETPPPLPDRFDELQNEIKERQDFLKEMETLGQGDKYRSIIATEISQKIREMEIIDRKRSLELQRMIEQEEKQNLKIHNT